MSAAENSRLSLRYCQRDLGRAYASGSLPDYFAGCFEGQANISEQRSQLKGENEEVQVNVC